MIGTSALGPLVVFTIGVFVGFVLALLMQVRGELRDIESLAKKRPAPPPEAEAPVSPLQDPAHAGKGDRASTGQRETAPRGSFTGSDYGGGYRPDQYWHQAQEAPRSPDRRKLRSAPPSVPRVLTERPTPDIDEKPGPAEEPPEKMGVAVDLARFVLDFAPDTDHFRARVGESASGLRATPLLHRDGWQVVGGSGVEDPAAFALVAGTSDRCFFVPNKSRVDLFRPLFHDSAGLVSTERIQGYGALPVGRLIDGRFVVQELGRWTVG